MRTGQFSFTKGEISEELIARVDVPAYATALRRARNVTILKYGGVTKRPGTRFVAEAFDSTKPVRLIPFQFSITQTYALELGQGYMRPAANGGLVLETLLTVQQIVTGVQTTIRADYHGFVAGDQVYFNNVNDAPWLNGKVLTIVGVPDSSNFTVDFDSREFASLPGPVWDLGGIVRAAPPAAPPVPPVVPPVVVPPAPPETGSSSFGGIYAGGGSNRDFSDYTRER